jgi:hypothetical protein
MGFDDQFYAASKRQATGGDPNEDPKKRARREEKQAQKELERKTKVGERLFFLFFPRSCREGTLLGGVPLDSPVDMGRRSMYG